MLDSNKYQVLASAAIVRNKRNDHRALVRAPGHSSAFQFQGGLRYAIVREGIGRTCCRWQACHDYPDGQPQNAPCSHCSPECAQDQTVEFSTATPQRMVPRPSRDGSSLANPTRVALFTRCSPLSPLLSGSSVIAC